MVALGFIFLGLVVLDLIHGLSPLLEGISTAIWIIFGLEFLLKFTLAPRKLAFLKSHWLTLLSLLLPAFRVFSVLRALRFLRLARVARGMRLVRVVGSLNRGMNTLRATLGRRGFGYVLALTAIIIFVGAAGMFAFENDQPGGLADYPSALWWTAMLMTTLGSEYWPRTLEGRVLCFMLALYSFASFGYVTATLATYFVDRDAASQQTDIAGTPEINALREEIAALRRELQRVASRDELSPRDEAAA
jgi:voltage-gated potassium channel